MGFGRIGADADHLSPELVELLEVLLEAPGLQGAAAGEILGLKIKRQPTALEVREAEFPFPARGQKAGQGEIGSRLVQVRQGAAQGPRLLWRSQ